MKQLLVFTLAMTLAACMNLTQPQSCTGKIMTESRLYLGLSMPSGRKVSEKQFAAFIAREVTPRLPEGFTIQSAQGSWQDAASRKTISENSRILIRLHENTVAHNRAIEQIAQSYKSTFSQDAVLRTDTQVCSSL